MQADGRLLIGLGKVQIVIHEEGQDFLRQQWKEEFAKLECHLPKEWNRWYISSEVSNDAWVGMLNEIEGRRSVLLNYIGRSMPCPTHIVQHFPQLPHEDYFEYLVSFIEINTKARMLIVSISAFVVDLAKHC